MSWSMKCLTALVILMLSVTTAQAVNIEMVTVGNPGNANDGTGYGSVADLYRIGKYEVTNAQYAEFLNSVATVGDANGAYNSNMGGGWNGTGGISRTGSGTSVDPWVYAARANRGNRPVNYVSWYDALRFANWLHNGRPIGAQGPSITEDGAYDMSLGSSVVRKPGATWFLPTEDEWYKAAYYKGGGTNAGYWDYPTRSDSLPTAELPAGTDMTNGSANYYISGYLDTTYYSTEVGAYDARPSDSAYGTFDQGANLWEWNEADIYGNGSSRGARGGSWGSGSDFLQASARNMTSPTSEDGTMGFRVASIPEPSSFLLAAFGLLGLLGWRRRRRR